MFQRAFGWMAGALIIIVVAGCTPKPVVTEVKQANPDSGVRVVKTEGLPRTPPQQAAPDKKAAQYELDGMTVKPKVEERPARSIPELFKALKAETWEERLAAVEDLGRSGNTSDEVIDALVNMYNDRYGQIYFAASDALRKIGPKAVPKIIEGLKFEGENARFAAAYTLKGINPPPVAALQPLIDALDDEGVYVRMYAVLAIAHLGAAAEPALPALEAVAANEEENPETRQHARHAVKSIRKRLAAQQ